MEFIVAIDGPAGTGKSSVAKAVAKKLGMIYVDTGAIYRALALLAHNKHVEPTDSKALVKLVPLIKVVVDNNEFCTNIMIDDKIVTNELRTEEISRLSSLVSSHKDVRLALLNLQRDLVNLNRDGCIFEGRDIGTVVFPKANLKIFVSADPIKRAERRFAEVSQTNKKAKFEEILKAIKERDKADEKRDVSPLKMAADAILLDTSNLSKEDAEKSMFNLIVKAKEQFLKESQSC